MCQDMSRQLKAMLESLQQRQKKEVEAELGCALDFPTHVWPRMDDHRVIQATGCN